jgi:heme exporter protein C
MERWLNVLSSLSAAAIMTAQGLAFMYAPTEVTMGHVQRIFYFHVSSAWVGFFAFFVTFVSSVIYLFFWRERRWDIVALSSAEIGVAFLVMVVTTGPLWAKSVWNTWWTWDPKLTTVLVLLFIYISYLMLRSMVENPEKRALLAAVVGIVGFADVPLVFGAVRWWGTRSPLHPIIATSEGFSLSPRMLFTLLFCLGAFTLLYLTLLAHRIRLERLADEMAALKEWAMRNKE